MLLNAICIVGAYLIGSFSFGLTLARLYGSHDLRQRGSGSTGATNVARILGKKAGVLTLAGDCSKGLLAVLLAQWYNREPWVIALVACSAVFGHIFPVYYRFRGGKGVATALGVLLPTLPGPLLGGLVVWGVVLLLWRYVSLGSIVAACIIPVLTLWQGSHGSFFYMVSLIAGLVLYKHRENIQRLLHGRESKLW